MGSGMGWSGSLLRLVRGCVNGAIPASEYSLNMRDELARPNPSNQFAPVHLRHFPFLVHPSPHELGRTVRSRGGAGAARQSAAAGGALAARAELGQRAAATRAERGRRRSSGGARPRAELGRRVDPARAEHGRRRSSGGTRRRGRSTRRSRSTGRGGPRAGAAGVRPSNAGNWGEREEEEVIGEREEEEGWVTDRRTPYDGG